MWLLLSTNLQWFLRPLDITMLETTNDLTGEIWKINRKCIFMPQKGGCL